MRGGKRSQNKRKRMKDGWMKKPRKNGGIKDRKMKEIY